MAEASAAALPPYLHRHRETVERAVQAAMQDVLTHEPDDPLDYVARHISLAAAALRAPQADALPEPQSGSPGSRGESAWARASSAAAQEAEAHAPAGEQPDDAEEGWSAESWMRSLALLRVLQTELVRPLGAKASASQQLDYLRALGRAPDAVAAFRALLSDEAVLEPLARSLADGATELAQAFDTSAQAGSGKFQAAGGFTLSYGSLDTCVSHPRRLHRIDPPRTSPIPPPAPVPAAHPP